MSPVGSLASRIRARFRAGLEEATQPLRDAGFEGGPWVYRRMDGQTLLLIALERTRSGDRYRIWLAAHTDGESAPGGAAVRDLPAAVRQECAHQRVLPREHGSDTRMMGVDERDVDARLGHLAELLRLEAIGAVEALAQERS